MSNQLKMGNVSRAASDIKKKLELSFIDKQESTEINNAVSKKKSISGNGALKAKESSRETGNTHISTELNKDLSAGNRYKKVVPRSLGAVKAKATFCLDTIALEQLNAVYIKRLSTQQKSDRSSLICEAISLLFEQEK